MTSEQATSGQIVVGVDGSTPSQAALEWVADHAARENRTLNVVTAWRWPMSYGYPLPVASDFDPAVDTAKVLDGALAPVRAAHPQLDIHTSVIEGAAAQVLVEASKDAELLVVGSRGHGELAGMLLGSVSEHCVAHAHCPVLVMRR